MSVLSLPGLLINSTMSENANRLAAYKNYSKNSQVISTATLYLQLCNLLLPGSQKTGNEEQAP